MKYLKIIDYWCGKIADYFMYFLIIAGLIIFGYYCDWEYKKANTKQALEEYQKKLTNGK